MTDYNIVFWTNVKRYQKLRGYSDADMAKLLGQSTSTYKTSKSDMVGTGIRRLGLYTEALDVSAVDLVEEWTDDEWDAYVKDRESDDLCKNRHKSAN